MLTESLQRRLGKIRATVFPIENKELKKFLMMSGMMFFIIYVYTVVRDTKDTLIVSSCGAEAITFLKARAPSAEKPMSPGSLPSGSCELPSYEALWCRSLRVLGLMSARSVTDPIPGVRCPARVGLVHGAVRQDVQRAEQEDALLRHLHALLHLLRGLLHPHLPQPPPPPAPGQTDRHIHTLRD